jgi:signal peptidase II
MPLFRTFISAVIAFGLDRLSKVVIVHWLDLRSLGELPVWPPYLNFVMAWNKGVNFGILSEYGDRRLLVVLAIAVSLALTAWASKKRGWLVPLATGAVVGGALGNAFDRLLYGAVADYLNMSCCGIRNPFSFNVADIFVVCGIGLIIIGERKHPGDPAASHAPK